MSGTSLKIPLAVSLTQLTDMSAQDALDITGKALPCSVFSVNERIVTVNFEMQSVFTLPHVQMPIAEWSYMQVPVQVGDKGVAISSDFYLGGVTGLGGGVADITQKANLSTLVFVPLSNTSRSTPDPNAVVLTGVGSSGVQLRSGDTSVTLVLTSSGVTVNMNGMDFVIANGDLVVGTTRFSTHLHSGVMAGGGNTGIPVIGS